MTYMSVIVLSTLTCGIQGVPIKCVQTLMTLKQLKNGHFSLQWEWGMTYGILVQILRPLAHLLWVW